MPGVLDFDVSGAADGGAKQREHCEQDCSRVRLCERIQCPHDLAGRAV
jgi:hypothetical protein